MDVNDTATMSLLKRWIPFRYFNNNITVKLLSNSLKRCLVNDKCTYLDILECNNWLCLHLGGPSKNMNETWMIMEIHLTLLIAFNLTPDNESWILFEYWALNFNWSKMEYKIHFWWIFFWLIPLKWYSDFELLPNNQKYMKGYYIYYKYTK